MIAVPADDVAGTAVAVANSLLHLSFGLQYLTP
jgi:hypothetical protein